MGTIAIRSLPHTPGLRLASVITSRTALEGVDAGTLLPTPKHLGAGCTTNPQQGIESARAVAYMASGDTRPDEALRDIEFCLRSGLSVVSPSLYALYDPESAPKEMVARVRQAAQAGGSSLLISGVDPGWGNDWLALNAAKFCTSIASITCQEIFDYSTYDQPFAVRELCGFGGSMDDTPMMLLASVPTMVWGGNVRLLGRSLGLQIDSLREEVERRPLEQSITNRLGEFHEGTQGAFRLRVIGAASGTDRIIIEHVTRIDPTCAPEWPSPDEGAGEHRVVIDGDPSLTVVVRADAPGGTRADGGNTTAVNRLLGALPWLVAAPPDIYDGLSAPLGSPLHRWEN